VSSLGDYTWLCLSAFIAGGVNALAGGGTLLTFPALIGSLTPIYGIRADVFANGTSTLALAPASLSSSWGYRRELAALQSLLIWLLPPSLLGGAIGTLLVTELPPAIFAALVPWLILLATTLLLVQPLLIRRKAIVVTEDGRPANQNGLGDVTRARLVRMTLLQFLIAIYGGYFGAGIGILMLGGLGLMGLTNIHQMNGLKCLLATAINGMSVIIFIWKGAIHWPYALAMMAASIVGGYSAAHFSRQVPGKYVRFFVIAVGFLLTGYFFAIRL
jgi:uncharacterized membrane protein YfcA